MPERGPTRRYTLHCGDCTEILPTLPTHSVDCVLTDPPYPGIKRDYGEWTEAEWFCMMRKVVPQVMRVVKPYGSAVFILQPNSARVGRMRTWLWEFMAWVGRDYGIVQDVWWWNTCALPVGGAITDGLLRPSVKACVWVGPPNCYRNQTSVLIDCDLFWTRRKWDNLTTRRGSPSGRSVNGSNLVEAVKRRGGSTPFNVLPMGNGSRWDMAGMHGHGAGTPDKLCDWWLRYILPPKGTVLDPFSGTGTVGVVSLREGGRYIGIERVEKYHAIAQERLAKASLPVKK